MEATERREALSSKAGGSGAKQGSGDSTEEFVPDVDEALTEWWDDSFDATAMDEAFL